jgi:hypothetical protein
VFLLLLARARRRRDDCRDPAALGSAANFAANFGTCYPLFMSINRHKMIRPIVVHLS